MSERASGSLGDIHTYTHVHTCTHTYINMYTCRHGVSYRETSLYLVASQEIEAKLGEFGALDKITVKSIASDKHTHTRARAPPSLGETPYVHRVG